MTNNQHSFIGNPAPGAFIWNIISTHQIAISSFSRDPIWGINAITNIPILPRAMAGYPTEEFISFWPFKIFRRSPNFFATICTFNPPTFKLGFSATLYRAIFTPTLFRMKRLYIEFPVANFTFFVQHNGILSKNGKNVNTISRFTVRRSNLLLNCCRSSE